MRRLVFWSAVLMVLCNACTDDDPKLPMPAVSGVPSHHGHDRDASDGELDAGEGTPDTGAPDAAVLTKSCSRVPIVQTSGDDIDSATSTERPGDFLVSRQVENWIVDDCTHPKLSLEFSDGLCPGGLGHQLTITLDLNDLADGAIHSGNNAVVPDSDSTGLQVRYTRPSRLSPKGTWGSCAGAAGQLIFLDDPLPTAGSVLDARYDMILTPCDGVDQDPQVLVGSLHVVLRFGLSRFCPDRSL